MGKAFEGGVGGSEDGERVVVLGDWATSSRWRAIHWKSEEKKSSTASQRVAKERKRIRRRERE